MKTDDPQLLAEAIVDDLKSDVMEAMEDFVEEVEGALIESISIPVRRYRGRYVRSSPGQPPRTQSGEYVASIDYDVTSEGDVVRGSVYSTSHISQFLEDGTDWMAARPHFGPIFERYATLAAQTIGQLAFNR